MSRIKEIFQQIVDSKRQEENDWLVQQLVELKRKKDLEEPRYNGLTEKELIELANKFKEES